MSGITIPQLPSPRKGPEATSPEISDADLSRWLACARPGDAITYYCGFLARDRRGNARIEDLANWANRLRDLGRVHLLQRKLDEEFFAYIAVAMGVPSPTRRRAA
jgi:hypothetical protein